MHIDQLLQINKMKIKIVIFHGDFQLLEKICTHRFFFGGGDSWNETPKSLLALKKWALGWGSLLWAHGARVKQAALGGSLLRLDA